MTQNFYQLCGCREEGCGLLRLRADRDSGASSIMWLKMDFGSNETFASSSGFTSFIHCLGLSKLSHFSEPQFAEL